MTEKTSDHIRFFLPSIADILFICIFLYLTFAGIDSLLGDGDTGYHIRAGEYITDTVSIPRFDIFSFLTPALPWTAHEWLSEVIMASIYRIGGLTGIVIFFSLFISSIYYIFFKIIKTYSGNLFIPIIIAILVIASSQIHWLARPHIFSLFFLVIWYHLLDKYQSDQKNYLYLFPLFVLLWVNLHGGYIIAFVLNFIFIAGIIAKIPSVDEHDKTLYLKRAWFLIYISVAGLFACLINPYGYHILLFPFKLTSNKFIMDNVNEFLSPNFHEPIYFIWLLFFMIGILSLSKKRLGFVELSLILLFTYMSLYSARYIPLYAVIVAPILVRHLDVILHRMSDNKFTYFINKRAQRIAAADASARGYVWPGIAVLLVILYAASGKIEYHFDEKKQPVAAVEFLKKERLSGNMFNNDEFGDYIIYAAWPEYKVFFDGRSDMYGEKLMKDYFTVTSVEPGFDDVIEKYDINWIIYNSKSALTQYLLVRDDWKLIYSDGVANIFIKNTAENRLLIEKYKDTQPVYPKENQKI